MSALLLPRPEPEIVFVARPDGLYDMVKHPRGLARNGLSRRERDAFAHAKPGVVVEVRASTSPCRRD